jgi:hypothetical protein
VSTETHVYELISLIYGGFVERSLVPRVEYDNLLSAAAEVYRENMLLRKRLRDLDRLASSWTGTPTRHPEIVRAREALRNLA